MKTLFIPLLILLLTACGGQGKQAADSAEAGTAGVIKYPVIIPFEKAVDTEREVKMSDIGGRILYVPLETNDDVLVARLWGAFGLVGDNLYMHSGNGVFQFKTDGSFVRRIGRKGQGPGEYTIPSHLVLDEPNNRLVIQSSAKKMFFDLDEGKYQRQMLLESKQFILLDDTTLAHFIYNSTGQMPHRIILSNLQGDTLKTFPQHDRFKIEGGMSYMIGGRTDRYMFHYNGEPYFKDQYNDTVFKLTHDALLPRYIFDMGKYHLPLEQRFEVVSDKNRFAELSGGYMRTNPIETDRYLFIPYSSWGRGEQQFMMLYDKQTGETFRVKGGKIINDLDGGIDFYPITGVADNVLLSYMEMPDVIELMEQNPSLREHEVLKNLTEDDNPLLMLLYLDE